MTDIIDELRWRGLVALSHRRGRAARGAGGGPVTYYCGFDPTAPSLHMGNLVQLLTMRRLQDAGHRPLALVGGVDRSHRRPQPDGRAGAELQETVAAWVDQHRRQVEPFLSFEGPNAAGVVNNLDWTAPLSALDFLRDIGKHYRVNTMLRKDAVADRLASEEGISYTEFSYQILQGLDFLELYRRYGCVLQTGGSDQWGNLTRGVDLIHRAEGASVHALATPADHQGRRHQVRQDRGRHRLARPADDLAVRLLPVLAQRRGRHRRQPAAGLHLPHPRGDRGAGGVGPGAAAAAEAQRALAQDVTTLVHGADAAERVEAASRALFGRDRPSWPPWTRRPCATPPRSCPRRAGGSGTAVVDLMAAAGLVAGATRPGEPSRRAAPTSTTSSVHRPGRASDQPSDLPPGRGRLLRRGKRTIAGRGSPSVHRGARTARTAQAATGVRFGHPRRGPC